MILQDRVDMMVRLGEYMLSDTEAWRETKKIASEKNGWFIPEFIELSARNIAGKFLNKEELKTWAEKYQVPETPANPKKLGIVMAGNIPLVGFHDLLAVFISGQQAMVKMSSKDDVLMPHLVAVLAGWDKEITDLIGFSSLLKNCDAYIATGSNNTSRYFEYYFSRFPHIIRKNKTSAAILDGTETSAELEKLSDDISLYFGLGCRNVTKVFVPQGYDFVPLLAAAKKYNGLADHHKYKNNYDYNLAIHILNNDFYMTNGSLIVVEEKNLFSPISQLNFEYYSDNDSLLSSLRDNPDLQCVTGNGQIPFGSAQSPSVNDYADRVDTMSFLNTL
jgi:hypothetical protein